MKIICCKKMSFKYNDRYYEFMQHYIFNKFMPSKYIDREQQIVSKVTKNESEKLFSLEVLSLFLEFCPTFSLNSKIIE